VPTGVRIEQLRELAAKLTTPPANITLHRQVARIVQDREKMAAGELPLDWGFAETLAYATLLMEGFEVRLTGQDSGRGTFFHRHAVWHCQKRGQTYIPLKNLSPSQPRFTVIDSLLSEEAVVGFEYGFSTTEPNCLTLWEAQFGDFVNGAQVIIDQFISSGEAKWGRVCGLTMLLPHGYEGQGPEHSSARLERFLALGAEGNIRVLYPTTPAQYFHLLRRQALHPEARPMVVMTPKSLLRLPAAASRPSELAEGTFRSVLDDPRFADAKAAESVRRVLLCSGKIYYDLVGSEPYADAKDVAIIRCERLYPFPDDELAPVLERYTKLDSFAWVQEEPRNMGARKFVLPRIRHLVPYRLPLGDISRPERSRPAEGYPAAHQVEQARIVREALTGR
jgi:2-oxoglutarate dehydrogenase E1 component